MKKTLFFTLIFFLILPVFSQTHISTESHQSSVTNIVMMNKNGGLDTSFLSTGDDGFIVKWTGDNLGEHYQISDVGIKLVAISPNGNDIALYESDGGSINKITVWDWTTLKRKYMKKFSDSITALTFSANGTYLIAGTATVDGAIFIRTSNWQIVDKLKTNTSIVNYIQTSDTEKTCVMYSPSGNLSYFDMQNGKLKQKLNVIQGLTQTLLFNNNYFLAGVRDNTIYIINAFKGTIISTVKTTNPIILSSPTDNNLYYLENDEKGNYELKMLENMENKSVSNPRIIKSFKGPRGQNSICSGTKNFTNIFLGSRNGTIYKADTEASITTTNLQEITKKAYSKIYDIASNDKNEFYFINDNSIYISSYKTGFVEKISDSMGQNKIISYKGNLILWSKSSKQSVSILSIDNKTTEELFTPKNSIQNLQLFSVNDNDYLVEIESNSEVNIYDFKTKKLRNIYSGTGIQDAVLANDNKVYISKSSSTLPLVPLICVDINTYETVPISLTGNVAFGLSTNGNMIYGIYLQSNEEVKSTYVFSYNISNKMISNILKFSDEDSEAFTYLSNSTLLTNIGKNKVYNYNISTKKRFSYDRTASIPIKTVQNTENVAILNSNGSISWCNNTSANILSDWYLTIDNQWYEF
ncbi:MAG: WD40 repeat domain-containing protein [Treponema sp.]|jgi:hypothetical protein|nr:WD40 repeat domain-containing protein [Treponema sp.]